MILTDRIQRSHLPAFLAHDWIVKHGRQVTICNPDLDYPPQTYRLENKRDDELTCSSCLISRRLRDAALNKTQPCVYVQEDGTKVTR